ncbi:MarR family winged helix-turn-helix transcriptional regulator [Anaeromicropila herbilytica]|uniref:HTH marR-type domain-containing protein n=1 Tax=Anaeromicropila herbilytica TaxID=2785025 RepID=A0A7R7IBB6_9FIRM|nr:MarR family transcriptional regulator [Anaeromicropila herbilytica]BCN29377.1 hypothetical protein bsdtb5_06720 [Anaeromicropila herbilytica]
MEEIKLEQLVLNMVNFHHIFEQEFTRLIPEINNSEISPLLSKILNEIHNEGITTASRISKSLDLSVPNTSRSINKLYKLGYIQKEQDKKDRRIVYLTLSIKGLELMRQYLIIYQEQFIKRLVVLSEQEIDELNHSFETVKTHFIKMRDLNNNKF